jgi:para-aminobenzoate synthetase / 4-amino-4-deoxychorismate lyase
MHTWIDFAAISAMSEVVSSASRTQGSAATRLAFGPPVRVLMAETLDEVRGVIQGVQREALAGRWCVGYVRYEAAPAWDNAFQGYPHAGPLAWFGVHDAPLVDASEPTTQPSQDPQRVQWQPGLSRKAFNTAMQTLQDAIAAGDLYQANLTTPLHGQLHTSPLDLFAALRRAQPGGFAAYIDTGAEQVLSVSPELFFDWQQGHLIARPMKGTAARGDNPEDDAAKAQQLRTSPKERAENVMIVDLIRNDLSRVALPNSVKVPRLCELEALPTVWQMVSEVHADTRPGTTLDDVFAALFPCGSVTGAPKVQAMRMIHALESQERGVYCGAVGVVRPGGAATFNVPIRTLVTQGAQVRCGIGSGITFDAQPDGEWQEWRQKRAFVERASHRFELLETLGLRDGVIAHEAAHLQRMAQAAAHFAYPWVLPVVQAALSQLQAQHPQGEWRVRLMLSDMGAVRCEAFALASTTASVALQLADRPLLHSQSEFVRYKTTHRSHYDAFTPSDSAVFDTVLWNTQGEVTECTRGNIALLLNGRWVTPALHCGLLAGVGRSYFLQTGRIAESVVHLSDLPRVQAIAFINSLRGWVDATWHAPLPNDMAVLQAAGSAANEAF